MELTEIEKIAKENYSSAILQNKWNECINFALFLLDKVWDLLGAVKTEFGKFGTVLQKTKEKLQSATSEIEKAETRSRQIERKLTKVEALPESDTANKRLEIDSDETE